MSEPLLDIQGLTTAFPAGGRMLKAVDGLDLAVRAGEVLGLVGESGCGKSLSALSVLGLLPPPGRVLEGRILFAGRDLLSLPHSQLRQVRGQEISMVFQEPMTSLNPVFTVGRQVAEQVLAHHEVSQEEAWARGVAMLEKVGIPDPARRAQGFPHQLSGGLRQRVMIAMALVNQPRLLMADEPTTALDVTIQAQILALMRDLQREMGMAILLITHNLAVVAQVAGRVAVMYAGRLLEVATVAELFRSPLHPYTQGLLACLPSRATRPRQPLHTIAGIVPALGELPQGCAFSDRCPESFAPCQQEEPALAEVAPGRQVRCYLHHRRTRGGQEALTA